MPEITSQEKIHVRFERNIYQNAQSGFTIALYKLKDAEGTKSSYVCKGDYLPDVTGVTFCFTGQWINDKKYGRQFNVSSFAEELGTNKDDIIAFLSSKLIKGIGKVTAKRIYEAFGENTFKVMDNDPKLLLKIKGITPKKYEEIIKSYNSSRYVSKIYQYISEYQRVSVKLCTKIYQRFGNNSISVLREHPYKLCYLKDVGFETADKIARAQGLPMDSYERFLSAAEHVLMLSEADGNVCMDIQEFGSAVKRVLNNELVTAPFVNDMTVKAITERHFTFKKASLSDISFSYIYRKATYETEVAAAKEISRLTYQGYKFDEKEVLARIKAKEINAGIELDPLQKAAVVNALTNSLSIVKGGPGTGKTTIIRFIADIYEDLKKDPRIVLMAPTGRASRMIHKSTGRPAATIHSTLRINDSDNIENPFILEGDEDETIENSLIVVDEMSMLDIWVAKKMFEAVREGCTMVLVGDPDQLQSVGAGAVFRDIIFSHTLPAVELTKVFRQGENSQVLDNAYKIKEGRTDLLEGGDFFIKDNLSEKSLEDEMIKTYLSEVNKYGIENVVCLCPVKDRPAGVNAMNIRLQEIINPKDPFKEEVKIAGRFFREGDLVMELKNTQDTSNGDIGKITKIKKDEIEVKFFENTFVTYGPDDYERLTLAYAMTVHKAQGSEYMSVVTCLQDMNRLMQKRSIPYTAFTRGKRVFFLGSKRALAKAIMNDDKYKRKSLLAYQLRFYMGQFVKVA